MGIALVSQPDDARLPVYLTRFFGRDTELENLARLLKDPAERVITLAMGRIAPLKNQATSPKQPAPACCFSSICPASGTIFSVVISLFFLYTISIFKTIY